ncbi:hypothetical protein LJC08_03535 [Methanimicrococcus sp. OttesenSCG-928-J09]|nr:hypothetical protein [Methanimicrococcus sp. OttesenSCG-928-J09]
MASIDQIINISYSGTGSTVNTIRIDGKNIVDAPEFNIQINGIDIKNTTKSSISIQNGAKVNLILNGSNKLTGGSAGYKNIVSGKAGIEVPKGCEITITSSNGGSLKAIGGNGAGDDNGQTGGGSGIGSNGANNYAEDGEKSGKITITKAEIWAIGGQGGGSGIGSGGGGGTNNTGKKGGDGGVVDEIKIIDSTITAVGGDGIMHYSTKGGGGSGIGSGGGGRIAGSNIFGNGGNVNSIIIQNSIITAAGGKSIEIFGLGSGIGSGGGGSYHSEEDPIEKGGKGGLVSSINISGEKTDIIVTSGGIGRGSHGKSKGASNGDTPADMANVIIESGNVLILNQPPTANAVFKNSSSDPVFPISFTVTDSDGKGLPNAEVVRSETYSARTRADASERLESFMTQGEITDKKEYFKDGSVTMWLPVGNDQKFDFSAGGFKYSTERHNVLSVLPSSMPVEPIDVKLTSFKRDDICLDDDLVVSDVLRISVFDKNNVDIYLVEGILRESTDYPISISQNSLGTVTDHTVIVDSNNVVLDNPLEIQIRGINVYNSSIPAISLQNKANVKLILSHDNKLTGGTAADDIGLPGIEVPDGCELTITTVGDDPTAGSLTAIGGNGMDINGGGAGIGSRGNSADCGSITIKDANVIVIGGSGGLDGGGSGSGIGSGGGTKGGDGGSVSLIKISGTRTDVITYGGIGKGSLGSEGSSTTARTDVIIENGNVLILNQKETARTNFRNSTGGFIVPVTFTVIDSDRNGLSGASVKSNSYSYSAMTRKDMNGRINAIRPDLASDYKELFADGTATLWIPSGVSEFDLSLDGYLSVTDPFNVVTEGVEPGIGKMYLVELALPEIENKDDGSNGGGNGFGSAKIVEQNKVTEEKKETPSQPDQTGSNDQTDSKDQTNQDQGYNNGNNNGNTNASRNAWIIAGVGLAVVAGLVGIYIHGKNK